MLGLRPVDTSAKLLPRIPVSFSFKLFAFFLNLQEKVLLAAGEAVASGKSVRVQRFGDVMIRAREVMTV